MNATKIIAPANSPLWQRASIDHLQLPEGGTPFDKKSQIDPHWGPWDSSHPQYSGGKYGNPAVHAVGKGPDPYEPGLGTVITSAQQAVKIVLGETKHTGLAQADAYAAAEALSAGANGAWLVLKGHATGEYDIAPALLAGGWKYHPDMSHIGNRPGFWEWENESFAVSSKSDVDRLYSDGALLSIVDGKVQIYAVNVGTGS